MSEQDQKAGAGTAAGAWAPFAHRVFTLLFIAQFVSNVGTWMQTVGAQWFLVEETDSPALVAWINTATTLPVLLLSLFAGVAADLFNRKRLIFWVSIASAAVGATLTWLTLTGLLTPALLLAATFLLGCAAAVIGPAWQAIQPELVARSELPAAASLATVTVNGARAVGPAIAGIIVAAGGPGFVFALNAVSFLAVAIALLAWKRPPQRRGSQERVLAGLAAGLRYVRSAPSVRRILWRSLIFTFPASALWALLPSAASSLMNAGAGGYSLLLALLGVGAVAGVVVMPKARELLSGSALLAVASILFAAGTAGAALLPLWGAAIASLVAGLGWILSLTTVNAGMQLILPAWVRARGLSVYLLVFMGSQAVGSFLWGSVSEFLGVRATLVLAAVLLVGAAASVLVLPMPTTIGRLDRGVVPMSADGPVLLLEEGAPDDQPVLVHVVYTVPEENRDAFLRAMDPVRRARRRTGAVRWSLAEEREAAERCRFVEEFQVGSWAEHQRQHEERWTGSDASLLEEARGLAEGTPEVRHYLVRSEG